MAVFLFCTNIKAQLKNYTVANAHSHNDYKQPHPFITAYNAAFGSIEVDVFLRDGQLLVAHDTAEITPINTLKRMYLDPLAERIQSNRGTIYANPSRQLILMIDIKEDAATTIKTLIEILDDYPALRNCKTLQLVITGNQPVDGLFNAYPAYLYFDGNLKKAYSKEAFKRIALFSDNFKNYSKWNGVGPLPATDKKRLDSAINYAHAVNKPIRFWGAPDVPLTWKEFMLRGIDYINTDNILPLTSFINLNFAAKDFDNPFILNEVIVTTQRSAQAALLVPYSTQSITKAYIQNYQPRTTPEAVMGLNGVFVQKTNHGGGSAFLRGLTGNQTLMLVDGIRLNNATYRYGPNQYLNTIDPYTISKIEVAKGTGSVQYGSDAIGGVLQVFTKDPAFISDTTKWSGSATAKYMTGNMEKTLRAEATYQAQKTAFTIGSSYRNFGDLIGGDTTGKQSPSGYKEFALDAKAKFLIKPSVELVLASQFLQQKHVPVYHRIVLENYGLNEFEPQQRLLNYARINLNNKQPWLNKIEITGSWQQTIEGRSSRRNGSNTVRNEKDQVNTKGFTVDVNSLISPGWSANTGVELYHDKVSSTRIDVNGQNNVESSLRGLYPNGSTNGNYSFYSLHHITAGKWLVEGGMRYNTFTINLTDTSVGKVNLKPSSFVYNTSVSYKIGAKQQLYLSYNTAFRAPNIDDLGTLGIVDFRYEVPTNNLKPERSINTEAGYKMQSDYWVATASVYYMHLSNLITRIRVPGEVINGYPLYRKQNVEEGYIKGFEATGGWHPCKNWQTDVSLSYTYGQSLSRNEPIRRIPPVNGRILNTYKKGNGFLSLDVLFAGRQNRLAAADKDDNRIPAGGTPGWSVFNLYAGYQLHMIAFNASFQNIFNTDYRTHGSGINMVGRSGWLSIRVTL